MSQVSTSQVYRPGEILANSALLESPLLSELDQMPYNLPMPCDLDAGAGYAGLPVLLGHSQQQLLHQDLQGLRHLQQLHLNQHLPPCPGKVWTTESCKEATYQPPSAKSLSPMSVLAGESQRSDIEQHQAMLLRYQGAFMHELEAARFRDEFLSHAPGLPPPPRSPLSVIGITCVEGHSGTETGPGSRVSSSPTSPASCAAALGLLIEQRGDSLLSPPQKVLPMVRQGTPPPSCSPQPLLADSDLPSVGSVAHAQRKCKPCAFMHKGGCESGYQCKFCHLCPPGEKKMRTKERKERWKAARMMRAEQQQMKQPVQAQS